jgi:hypothetical protein
MTVFKRPLDPQRVRHFPEQGFSWIDRRFVRDGWLDQLAPDALLLYFFLTAVSDREGLSFYADSTAGSGGIRPPIPDESDHPFRLNPTTHSDRIRPLVRWPRNCCGWLT